MDKIIPFAVFGLIAWAGGLFGPDKRARALRKARAAKARLAKMRRRAALSKKRTGRKLTKAERRAIALRNLAKARRARKRK